MKHLHKSLFQNIHIYDVTFLAGNKFYGYIYTLVLCSWSIDQWYWQSIQRVNSPKSDSLVLLSQIKNVLSLKVCGNEKENVVGIDFEVLFSFIQSHMKTFVRCDYAMNRAGRVSLLLLRLSILLLFIRGIEGKIRILP